MGDLGRSDRRAWTVVATDERDLTIRSYQDGDDLHAAFVVVPAGRATGRDLVIEWLADFIEEHFDGAQVYRDTGLVVT